MLRHLLGTKMLFFADMPKLAFACSWRTANLSSLIFLAFKLCYVLFFSLDFVAIHL